MTTGSTPLLHFLIFSFNRGEFLQNCVESILRCAPGHPITVWDDNSTDPMTCQVLADLSQLTQASIAIRQPALDADGKRGKHGGLYNNLQSAWRSVPDSSLICCIQDDMQLVRPVSQSEIAGWKLLLDSSKHRGFMQPAFLKAVTAETVFVAEKDGYHINRQHRSAGAWYSDVFMVSTELLASAGWQFKNRESHNEQQARQHFDQMVYLKNPFVGWLPGAPAWRGKRRTLAMRLAEKSRRCGFYPLQCMNNLTSQHFCQRSAEQLPLAESYLSLRSGSLEKPWFYYPLQDQRALKLLNKIELWIN